MMKRWPVRRKATARNPCKFGLSLELTINLALARFRGIKMTETISPLRVRRRFEVEAASEEEAVAIVLRNMRESLEAEGFKVKAITAERVNRRA